MNVFIESICLLNRKAPLLAYHQKRVDQTFLRYFPGQKPILLASLLPANPPNHKQKLRVEYDQKVQKVDVSPYHQRPVNKLKLVDARPELNYAYKYSDRSLLQALYEQRGEADDIIIIKNGLVTDSFYSNVAFWDGSDWFTPKSYLLKGTRRTQLLETGQVKEQQIKREDIRKFKEISLINGLLDLGESTLPTSQII